MANPLLGLLYRLFVDQEEERDPGPGGDMVPDVEEHLTSAGILLVLRRMRIPLIVLIVIFAISVLGLALIPGEDEQGNTYHVTIFEAFYFMAYTASTIGFGELPVEFTALQRMWVTVTIFMSVIGWAYAVGSLLALMQDRAFRQALARRRFAREVMKLNEPFLLLVGYGEAMQRLARSLDDMGRRFVVVDRDENRVAAVELDAYRADTPALLGEARDTGALTLAGLGHKHCEGVVAMTGNDEANLDVTMTTALLRPGLHMIARTSSRDVAERMSAFGEPEIINPLDRFGDHLRILLRSPASYQLMIWLTSAPGTTIQPRRPPLPRGRWVVHGSSVLSRELTHDLRAEGLEVTTLEDEGSLAEDCEAVDSDELRAADLEHAGGFIAATGSDTTNLWLIQAAGKANPDVYRVAMQNRAGNSALFREVGVDFGLVPSEVIAHEVVARLANPVLMRFLPKVPHQSSEWAESLVDRLVERCGTGTPSLFRIWLTEEHAPALARWLDADGLRLGDFLRNPQGREQPLDMVTLALLREGTIVLSPDDDYLLRRDDRLLVAGRPSARQALDATLVDEPTAIYTIDGYHVPSSWVWRKLSRDRDASTTARS